MTKPAEVGIPSIKTWTKAAAKSAPGGDVSKLNWVTPEDVAVKPLCTKGSVVRFKALAVRRRSRMGVK